MKRNLNKVLIMAVLLTLLSVQAVFAGSEEDIYVRIRLRFPRLFNEQVSFEGFGEIFIYDDDDEFLSLDNNLTLRIDTYYASNYYLSDKDGGAYGPYHAVVWDEIYSSYEDAYEVAVELEEEYDEFFYPYLIEDGYIIAGGNFADKRSAENLAEELYHDGYNAESFNGNLENIIAYNKKNRPVFMYEKDMPLYFSSYNYDEDYQMIKVDNRTYRGKIRLIIIEDFKLLTINYVELENYLYGVVPNEIPSSWGMEALKAQALAARTYAVYNIKPRQIYDMEDNQNSQVYMGYDYEKSSTNRAVDETRGQMIYYDGKLIEAFYHSTSGGSTENSENVWYEAVPYLRGVPDEFSDNSGSPHTTWQVTYYKEDIIRQLNLDDHDVNELYGIEIKKVSENNRVIECIFLTDAGEISYKKEYARLLLGLKSSWFTVENGASFYFITEYFPISESPVEQEEGVPSRGGILDLITDGETEETGETGRDKEFEKGSLGGKYVFTDQGPKKLNREKVAFISSKGVSVIDTDSDQYNFEGRGWGHGIGMSQYGAKQMAEEGYTYEEILKYYYTGVTVK
jgi:stage II sporulation protein D